MSVSKAAVAAAYQRHAGNYDLALKFYRLIGLRIGEYRARAIELLNLKAGDRVVDLGCAVRAIHAAAIAPHG